MSLNFKCISKSEKNKKDDALMNSQNRRGNIINRAYKCLQSKIIQHAIPNSDWPAPQLIFGSKQNSITTFSKNKSNLMCHNERNGSVRTNSKDMSTIVSGFMQFENNFKRKKSMEALQHSNKQHRNSEVKEQEMNSVSITVPSFAMDPDSLGAAIEFCLKQKLIQ